MRTNKCQFVLPLVIGGCLSGCVNPGVQTATGLKQTGNMEYTADALKYVWEGSQEAEWVFAEGKITLNEDGTINPTESQITGYVYSKPSAEQAANTMAVMAEVLKIQSQMVNERIAGLENLLGNLLPLFIPAPVSRGEADSVGLRSIIEEMIRDRMVPVPEPAPTGESNNDD